MIRPIIWKAVSKGLKAYHVRQDIESAYEAMKYLGNDDYDEACNVLEDAVSKQLTPSQ